MAGSIVMVGEDLNNLARMSSVLTLSAAALSGYESAWLYDLDPSRPLIIGSVPVDLLMTADQNMSVNGGFESSLGIEWTDRSVGASNTALRTTTAGEFDEGTAGLECTMVTTGASNLAGRSEDFDARAGETIYLTFARRGDATVLARATLQNLHTGKYWTGSAWQTAAVDFDTRADVTFATFGPTGIVIESMPAGQPELAKMTLRLTLYANGDAAGAAYFDAVYFWPGTNMVCFVGTNLTPRVALQVLFSTDGAAFTQEGADITAFPQAFYRKFSMRAERYIRFKLSGTPYAAPVFGEIIAGQYLELPRAHAYPEELAREHQQSRVGSKSYRHGDFDVRSYRVSYNIASADEYAVFIDRVWGASRGGHFPLVFVPVSDDPEVVYARIEPTLTTERTLRDDSGLAAHHWMGTEFRVTELPLYTLLP